MNDQIISALNWRYAANMFDTTKKVSDTDLQTILESGRLAPSSYGTEPWGFVVVNNPELRTKLRAASWDQPKVTDASHFIVICASTKNADQIANERVKRTSAITGTPEESLAGLGGAIKGLVGSKDDAERARYYSEQAYIALGVMTETAALLNVDNAPMSGFDPSQYDEILELADKNLTAVVAIALGYRSDSDPAASAPKVRRSFDEVVTMM
jgi:nitroreductase